MKIVTHARWRVRLQIALWRHGSAGAAVLATLLVAAALLAWLLQQAHASLAQTRHARAQENSSVPTAQTPVRHDDEAARLSALQAVLAASPAPGVCQIFTVLSRSGVSFITKATI